MIPSDFTVCEYVGGGGRGSGVDISQTFHDMILPKNHVFRDAPRHEEVEASQHLVPIHVLYVGVAVRQQLSL